jgi:TolB protein
MGLGGVAAVQPASATVAGNNGQIAWSGFADAAFTHADIVSANPDGTGLHKLTRTPSGTYDFNPDWSPDGTKLAFERDTPDGAEIFTMNADGSDLRQITHDEFPGAGDPAWSPDGRRIAAARFDIPAGRDGIYILDADGSHPVQVTQNNADPGENAEPQWSPDGTKLVLQIVSDTAGSAIFTIHLDGTDEQQITPYGLDAEHPDWSPDGNRIVFESYGDGPPPGVSTNVFTVRPDGSHLVNVTNYSGGTLNAANPAWAPDGKHLTFVQKPGSGNSATPTSSQWRWSTATPATSDR